MSDIGFELEAVVACKHDGADYYAKPYALRGRHSVLPLSQLQLDAHGLRSQAPSSLARHLKAVVRESAIDRSKLAMVVWYRHCNHEGWRRLERLAVHALQHPAAKIIDVVPANDPPVNDRGLAVLSDPDKAFVYYQSAVCPTLQHERDEQPIRQVLEIPYPGQAFGAGYVALRGIETIISSEQLY